MASTTHVKHVKPKSMWKKVDIPANFGSDELFSQLISFEELTDYEIVTDFPKNKNEKIESKNQREKNTILQSEAKVKKKQKRKQELPQAVDNICSLPKKKKKTGTTPQKLSGSLNTDVIKNPSVKLTVKDENDDANVTGMEAWKNVFVPKPVLRALKEDGFLSPTPIQILSIPHAIRDRMDIIGAAETGSGKTLAFGVPVIHSVLKTRDDSYKRKNDSINLTEKSFLNEINQDEEMSSEEENEGGDNTDQENEEEDSDGDTDEEIHSEIVSDNMSIGCVKVIDNPDFSDLGIELSPSLLANVQDRKKPVALILEPTRELAIQVKNHLNRAARFANIKIAPIIGGLSVQKQQRILKKAPEIIVATPGRLWELIEQGNEYLSKISEIKCLVVDEADRMIQKGHFEELTKLMLLINKNEKNKKQRQTLVFSATLTTIHSGPSRILSKKVKMTEAQKLEQLMKSINVKDKPKVVDLTKKTGTAETLTEARINCTSNEKDLYLYYFLRQHPGRTLVFANSKDCIRRLVSVFTLLQTNPLPLHADMHQKQRLKNLERFTSNSRGLLLASDVAARGLDIPNVQHVIHYQVPTTVENYIHRSGRTARASKEGLSIMFIGQEDMRNYRKIIHTLNRSEELPLFPMENSLIPEIKKRVSLAQQIDKMEHGIVKKKKQNDWFVKAAKEADLELDEDNLLNDLGDSHVQSVQKQKLHHLKQDLQQMLKTTITPTSFSGKYPTKSGKLVMPIQVEDPNPIPKIKKEKDSQHRNQAIKRQRKKKFKKK